MPQGTVWRRGDLVILTDPGATDIDLVVGFLRTTYWGSEVAPEDLVRSFEHSLVYNLVDEPAQRQAGFARVLTDTARFAWLSDVFILDAYRGQGLGDWLVTTILADPRLARVRSWMLATRDAHAFYRRHGFEDAVPDRYMVFAPPGVR